ncbi:MAG: hypothetical protein ACW985_08715 [Candidatus Thorarchaeota archaeon]|jgi:hypothetical protein
MKDPMQVIEDTTFRLLKMAVTKLPRDVEDALIQEFQCAKTQES